MENDILTWALLGVGVLGFGAGAVWQTIRRKPARAPRRVERVAARASGPEKRPAAPEPVREPEAGVLRPTTLAVTPVAGDVTAAELFLQRAHEGDLPYYRELETDPHDLKGVSALFARCPTLEWTPEDDWAHDVYTVSFSPVVTTAWAAGHMPRVNATAMDLQIIALGDAGVQLGTRFVMTEESNVHPAFKEAFIHANARDAISTPQYDSKLPVVAVRALRNRGTAEFGALQLRLLRELEAGTIHRQQAQEEVEKFWIGALRRAAVEGDVEMGSMMAGQSVGLVDKVIPIRELLDELLRDADRELVEIKRKLSC